MKTCYSKNKLIEISGSLEELIDMRDAIVDFAESEEQVWTTELNSVIEKIGHLEKYLSQIIIRKSHGKININVIGGKLIISGNPEHLWPLSSYFDFEESDRFPAKNRLAYHNDHAFLNSKSLSVIISILN